MPDIKTIEDWKILCRKQKELIDGFKETNHNQSIAIKNQQQTIERLSNELILTKQVNDKGEKLITSQEDMITTLKSEISMLSNMGMQHCNAILDDCQEKLQFEALTGFNTVEFIEALKFGKIEIAHITPMNQKKDDSK